MFGRGGLVTHALSAVDIALWDIAGKVADAPLHRLLGGGAGDLACYASLEAYADPSVVRARVRQALDAGFKSIKLHEREPPAIRAAREEAGPEVQIMVDVNCAWTVNQARALAPELREFGLKWLEEPVWPPENYDGLAELRRTEGIPLASGENVGTLMEFDRLLRAGAVDFVQPSPVKMGGRDRALQGLSDRGGPQRRRDAAQLLRRSRSAGCDTGDRRPRHRRRDDRVALLRSRGANLRQCSRPRARPSQGTAGARARTRSRPRRRSDLSASVGG